MSASSPRPASCPSVQQGRLAWTVVGDLSPALLRCSEGPPGNPSTLTGQLGGGGLSLPQACFPCSQLHPPGPFLSLVEAPITCFRKRASSSTPGVARLGHQ